MHRNIMSTFKLDIGTRSAGLLNFELRVMSYEL